MYNETVQLGIYNMTVPLGMIDWLYNVLCCICNISAIKKRGCTCMTWQYLIIWLYLWECIIRHLFTFIIWLYLWECITCDEQPTVVHWLASWPGRPLPWWQTESTPWPPGSRWRLATCHCTAGFWNKPQTKHDDFQLNIINIGSIQWHLYCVMQ